jgi:hypothetical protein
MKYQAFALLLLLPNRASDPDAEGFYLKKGALKFGEVYSGPQKRKLPKLIFTV